MRTITLQVQDKIYEHIMFFLKNLNQKGLKIVNEIEQNEHVSASDDIQAYSNHSANTIEDWQDNSEDKIWI